MTSTSDQLRLTVAAALRSAVDAHGRGAFEEIGRLYDRLAEAVATLDGVDPDVSAAIHFLDGWYDSSNHDWMYYLPWGAGDWPRLGAKLAADLESRSAIDAAVRERFTFTARRGVIGRVRDFLTGKAPTPRP